MEDEDVLANITATLGNNILNEKTFCAPQIGPSIQTTEALARYSSFPLLESDDDEAFTFFLKQQNILHFTKSSFNKKMLPKRAVTKSNPHSNLLDEDNSRKLPWVSKIPRQDSIVEINVLNEIDSISFEKNLHMSKTSFLNIFKSVGHLLKLPIHSSDMMNVPPLTAYSLALWKLTTDQHFEEIARRFHVPLQACQLVIRKFWHIISENYESFIRWPNSYRAQQNTIRDFQNIAELKTFDKLFGVIAIKRLDIFLESADEEVSVVLQIICNAQRKVIDCFVELAKEYSFERSPIGQTLNINTQTIPTGSYIIGDSSFPLRHFLMRPFEFECFRQETVFNRMLLPALTIGQCVLEMMEQRFHTLYALEAKDISEVRKVLETISSLHNLCIDHQDNYVGKSQSFKAETGIRCQHSDLLVTKGNEKNSYGREARMKLMERILQ